jgi:plasmid stabilization system protein ParE
MKLIFAPEAVEDLENIYCYYAERNENYAVGFYNQIINEAKLLQRFPLMAPEEPLLKEYPEEYRSRVVWHNYKLVYFVENETVNIVSVFDCRQNPKKLKKNIRKYK